MSEFHFRFNIENADVESPNNATIRLYNLKQETLNRVTQRGEYDQVVLNAGYRDGNFGVIFQGTIKQFRKGRENSTDTYLDILASDGDIGYNQGFLNQTLDKTSSANDRVNAIIGAMPGIEPGYFPDNLTDTQHIPNLRGKVLFGMARAQMRMMTSSLDASWSIQNGKVNIIPLTGYMIGDAVELNRMTGLIGLPEQTDGGIKIRCLLNSKLRIGGLVRITDSSINQLLQQNPNAAPIPFNQWTGFQNNTPLSADGTYRLYVVEHEGDTRGQAWYSNLIALAVDVSAAPADSVSLGV